MAGLGQRKVWIYLGLGLLGFLLFLSILAPNNVYPGYTSYSPRKDGVKAFYLLLEKLDFRVERLTEAAPDGKGLMIMAEPDGIAAGEIREMLKWVEKGNALLLLTRQPNELIKELGVNWRDQRGKTGKVKTDSGHPFFGDVKELVLDSNERLRAHPRLDFSYGDRTGEFLAVVERKRGRVVILTDPDLITNKNIDQGDNLILLLNILRAHGDGTIWFNELVHGYSTATSVREEMSWPLRLVVVQLALGLLLLFQYWGKRFGRPVPLLREKEQVTGEYVSSLANIYRQGRARQITLQNLYQGFRRELTRYLGVPAQMPNKALVKVFAQRPGMDVRGLESLLERSEAALLRSDIQEMELFTLAREFELWRRENLSRNLERRKDND